MSSDPAKLTNENLIDLAVKFSTWPPAHWIHTQCSVGDEVAVRCVQADGEIQLMSR